jgi:ubiquitin-protein ligase E3 C
MFQSFSGTSRRPRQVNLSGQDLNPFAASSWAPTASGTQKTVAAAQQERQQRQRERERLNAAKRIQRTWRGHKARQDLAASRRLLWDEMESRNGEVADVSRELSQELRLLLTFYDSQKEQDTERLSRFCGRLLEASQNHVLSKADMRPYLRGLAAVLLVTLEQ